MTIVSAAPIPGEPDPRFVAVAIARRGESGTIVPEECDRLRSAPSARTGVVGVGERSPAKTQA